MSESIEYGGEFPRLRIHIPQTVADRIRLMSSYYDKEITELTRLALSTYSYVKESEYGGMELKRVTTTGKLFKKKLTEPFVITAWPTEELEPMVGLDLNLSNAATALLEGGRELEGVPVENMVVDAFQYLSAIHEIVSSGDMLVSTDPSTGRSIEVDFAHFFSPPPAGQ